MLPYDRRLGETVPRTLGVLLLLIGMTGGLTPVAAQLIPVKTAPVATGYQFQLHPSQSRAMGDLSLSIADTLGDAFVNPAKAARLGNSRVFSAPTYYTITEGDGAARTLSVGGLFTGNRWFGGGSVALQQLAPGPSPGSSSRATPALFSTIAPSPSRTRPLRESAAENQYATVLGGLRLSSRFALAGTVHWSDLHAMDGVELLYPGNDGLHQDGHRLDVRIGLLGDWSTQSVSLLLLHNRVDMSHEVQYVTASGGYHSLLSTRATRIQHYDDRTNTWGLHLNYVGTSAQSPWHLGTALTANRKNHPKIPNYDLMNIPRDPGTSWAYDVGIALSRQTEESTFGIDFVFEPIFSETWANAQETIPQPDGGTILPGERRITNDFTFANSTLRIGLDRHGDGWRLAGGLHVQTIRYWMTQTDHVAQSERDQEERWSEWRLTWGGGLQWDTMQIQYDGHLTLGTGQPGVNHAPPIDSRFCCGERRPDHSAKGAVDTAKAKGVHPSGVHHRPNWKQ